MEVPLAPAARPPSSSWSRSATSCDVDTPVGTPWRYLRCSSPCTWPRPKPIRSTACTAGHWLQAGRCWSPPASARQGEGCWTEGSQGPGPRGPSREAAACHCGMSPGPPQHKGPCGHHSHSIHVRVRALFPGPVSEVPPHREDGNLITKAAMDRTRLRARRCSRGDTQTPVSSQSRLAPAPFHSSGH